jgi:ribonuclease P protein component
MLSKINRIRKDSDFRKVFKLSRPVYGEKIMVRIVPSKDRGETRFGFVLSNKIEKRATRRNSLKRRLRAIVRNQMMFISPSIDVIITVKQNFNYPYRTKDIENELISVLKKANIYNEKNYQDNHKAISKNPVS